MVFYWSLSDNKYPQVSSTLLSILADFDNAIVFIVITRFPIFKSSSPFSNPIVTVPLVSSTLSCSIDFSSLARSSSLLLFSLSFSFTQWSTGTPNSTIQQLLFSFCWLSLGLIVWPRLGNIFVSQNPREVCGSHCVDGFWVIHMPFVGIVKFKLLAQFSVNHLPHSVV